MKKHSSSYLSFKEQSKASGRKRLEGYDSNLLSDIFDWERDEIEKDIWDGFKNRNDTDLAKFMPLLKKYDGYQELLNKLEVFNTPSDANTNIALVLLKETREKRYLNMILQDYYAMDHKESIVVELSQLVENPDVYNSLLEIYISDNKSDNRITALCSILWKHGILQQIDDIKEFQEKITLIRKLSPTSEAERKEIAQKNNW